MCVCVCVCVCVCKHVFSVTSISDTYGCDSVMGKLHYYCNYLFHQEKLLVIAAHKDSEEEGVIEALQNTSNTKY